MAINFTNNIAQYTTIQRTAKAKQFREFGSKKQLQDADILSDKELRFVTSIKGTFSFAVHNDGRYVAVTLYRANLEKKYNFLVLDLQAQAIAEVNSIKEAKAAIMELVEGTEAPEAEAEEAAPAEEAPVEETVDPVAEVLGEFLGEQNDTDKKSKKSTKTA